MSLPPLPPLSDLSDAAARRRRRYWLRDVVGWHASPDATDRADWRVRACGRTHAAEGHGIAVRVRADGSAGYGGLLRCGSIWACPVCSADLRAGRARELERGARLHLASGGGLAFLTLTVRHDQGHRLADLLGGLRDAWRSVTSGRFYQGLRADYGLVGTVKATEVTVGENGWHPHLHLLLFTAAPLDADALEDLRARLSLRWLGALDRLGYDARADVGCVLQPVTADDAGIAWYLSKVQDDEGNARTLGVEACRADLKLGRAGSRTPFEVLADLGADGDPSDRSLWLEYVVATRGARAVVWSHGLRARLGVDEVSDDDLLEDDPSETIVSVPVPSSAWRVLLETRSYLLFLELLEGLHADGLPPEALVETASYALLHAATEHIFSFALYRARALSMWGE